MKLIYIVALRAEAEPLIKYYKLRRLMNHQAFEIYKHPKQDIYLAISGIGMLAASSMTAYLAGKDLLSKQSLLINLGIAGGKNWSLGELILIAKASSEIAKQNFYPTKFFKTNLTEAALLTVSKVPSTYPEQQLLDMEFYAIYAAAKYFISSEQIQSLKIISDKQQADINDLTKEKIEQLIANKLLEITKFAEQLWQAIKQEAIYQDYPPYLAELTKLVHFSKTQQHQLEKLLITLANQEQKLNIAELSALNHPKKIIAKLTSYV